MPAGVEMFRNNKGKPGEVVVTDEDAKIINEVLTPYWAGKTMRPISSGHCLRKLGSRCTARIQEHNHDDDCRHGDLSHAALAELDAGLQQDPHARRQGIREEAQAKLAALSEPRDIVYQKPFLEAVVMTCDAMMIWSRRYAKLALELAAKEKNPQRKKELEEMAAVCEWVPENPARTFREALQAQWWGQMFNRIEQTSSAMGQGRWDQYLWPFYQKDLARAGSRRSQPRNSCTVFGCRWRSAWSSS